MKLQFVSKKEEVIGVCTLVFEAREEIAWRPGQYMHYVLEHSDADDRGVERWFTISSAPFERHITITTRLDGDPESSFKKALSQMGAGDTIEADGPKGNFVLREGDWRHVLIAGGIGITPYRSMLAQLGHEQKPANAILLYANRDKNFVFEGELDTLAAKDPTLKIQKFIDRRITKEDLAPYVADTKSLFYLSGPKAMVEAYEHLLAEMGAPESNIMTDYFPGY